MHLISINTGLPEEHIWKGKQVQTGIFKHPVAGPVQMLSEHLAGDGHADLRVHGGPNKAVYSYPQEHYAYWADFVPADMLVPGAFGENLTTLGLLEDQVRIGDYYQIGTAVLMAVQPRQPCFKLGIRLQDDSLVQRFEQARRSGIYFRVAQPGILQAGDTITLVQPSPYAVTIQDLVDSNTGPKDPDKIRQMLEVPHLTPSWRERLTRMLAE